MECKWVRAKLAGPALPAKFKRSSLWPVSTKDAESAQKPFVGEVRRGSHEQGNGQDSMLGKSFEAPRRDQGIVLVTMEGYLPLIEY